MSGQLWVSAKPKGGGFNIGTYPLSVPKKKVSVLKRVPPKIDQLPGANSSNSEGAVLGPRIAASELLEFTPGN